MHTHVNMSTIIGQDAVLLLRNMIYHNSLWKTLKLNAQQQSTSLVCNIEKTKQILPYAIIFYMLFPIKRLRKK